MANNMKTEANEAQPRPFNPTEHVIQIKSGQSYKDYLPVQWRLVWFRSAFPQGSIETEILHLDLDRDTEEEGFAWNNEKRRNERVVKHANGFVMFKATVKDGLGGVATGTKSEKAASFPDFIEKAETGAIGRALAALGYGTQFAPEMDEAHRIVDSPVDRQPNTSNNGSEVPFIARPNAATSSKDTQASNAPEATQTATGGISADAAEKAGSITERQVASIQKLCQYLGKTEPVNVANLSLVAAKKVIQQLSGEYNEAKKQNNKAS